MTSIVRACLPRGHDEALHAAITTAFVIATGAIALCVDDLGIVLAVVGATGSTIVSYILPGLCYFVLFPRRATRWLGLLILLMGCVVMPTSLYFLFVPSA